MSTVTDATRPNCVVFPSAVDKVYRFVKLFQQHVQCAVILSLLRLNTIVNSTQQPVNVKDDLKQNQCLSSYTDNCRMDTNCQAGLSHPSPDHRQGSQCYQKN